MMWPSACAAPAISQSRYRRCRAAGRAGSRSGRTGRPRSPRRRPGPSRSSRIGTGSPRSTSSMAMPGPARRAARPDPPRLWIRNPSKSGAVRVDLVDVRRQGDRRLRLADRPVAARRPGRGRHTTVPEDVEHEGVAGVVQAGVPGRVVALEPGAAQPGVDRATAALDAGVLRGDADPGVPTAKDLLLQVGPVGRRVLAAADVEPLGEQCAAEPGRVDSAGAAPPGSRSPRCRPACDVAVPRTTYSVSR